MDVLDNRPTENSFIGLDEADNPRWYIKQSSKFLLVSGEDSLDDSALTFQSVNYDPFRRGKFYKAEPLFQNQSEIWLASNIGGREASSAFNISCTISLNCDLDWQQLQSIISSEVQATELFRTAFSKTGRYRLVKCDSVHESDFCDLEELSDLEAKTQCTQHYEEQVTKPFSIECGELLRTTVIKLKPAKYKLIFTTHHIVCDRRGLLAFMNKCLLIYDKLKTQNSQDAILMKSEEFDLQEDNIFKTDKINSAREYWQAKLNKQYCYSEFPIDFPRSSERNYACEYISKKIDSQTTYKIYQVAQEYAVQPKVILLSVYAVLLSKLNQANQISFGLSTSLRDKGRDTNYLGNAVSLVPMFLDINSSSSFIDLIKKIDRFTHEIYENNHVSYGEIISSIDTQREVNRPPLFSTTVSFSDARSEKIITKNRESLVLDWTPRKFELFDKSINFIFDNSTITVECYFKPSLFSADIIDERFAEFQLVLDALLENKNLKLLSLVSKVELENYLKVNETNVPVPDMRLEQLFEKQVDKTPDKIAAIDYETSISFQELNDKASKLASFLSSKTIPIGSVVGICLERKIDYLIATIATLKAGLVFVPIEPGFPKFRIRHMIIQSNAEIVLTESQFVEQFSCLGIEACDFSAKDFFHKNEINAAYQPQVQANSNAYIMFTSGSSGKPKGVMISHQAIVNFIQAMQSRFLLGDDNNFLATTTFSFDISLLELFLPICNGAKVTIASNEQRLEPNSLANLLDTQKITHIQATPTTWRLILKAKSQQLPHVTALCGGEPISMRLRDKLLRNVSSLWNMYGPTETTVWSSCHQLSLDDNQLAIGKPIDNTQFYILDTNLNLVPRGVAGELYIGGLGLFEGYKNATSLTQKQLVSIDVLGKGKQQLYKTGDLVKLTHDNNFKYIARIDRQTKIRGHRIELAELEHVLEKHPSVEQCVAKVVDIDDSDNKLAVYVKFVAGKFETTTQLRKFVRQYLPDYMLPQFIIQLERFPLTANRKVDISALPEVEADVQAQPFVESSKNFKEHRLAEICAHILEKDVTEISLLDNFFEIGGSSLNALQVIDKIEQATGSRLSPRLFVLESLRNIAQECHFVETSLDSEHVDSTKPKSKWRKLVANIMDWNKSS